MLALPETYDDPKRYTKDLCDFISTPLIKQLTGGIHVNDALIYDGWGRLPKEWTDWWLSLPDHRLAQRDLIECVNEAARPLDSHNESSLAQTRPESLTKWLSRMQALALPRAQRKGSVMALPEVLETRMKTKKIAEISTAVAYIHDVCVRRGISRIIDMGSGQGYLSVALAHLHPGLKILAIDGSEKQIAGSQLFATSLGISEDRLKHMIHWIDGSSALAEKIENWADGQKCMLAGLHACGSLSEHMLKYFATIPSIDSLAAIGCCYNHIIPRSSNHPEGFPISSLLRSENLALNSTALMTACQAPSNWTKPDLTQGHQAERSSYSTRRLYRAMLEKLLFDKAIKMDTDDRMNWGIRKGDTTSFVKFARRAMDCLGLDQTKISTEELLLYEERFQGYEGRIAILWTLGVLSCKVIESAIAMDRYWYLAEKEGIDVDVFPIFEFEVSPRNLIIVAEKKMPFS